VITEANVYAHLGEDGFARLVRAFYAQVPGDDILGPLYAQSMAASGETLEDGEVRLREFLIGRFGGPQRYVTTRGHPRLRIRHAPFAVTAAGAERWIGMMEKAMGEAGVGEEVARVLRPYFVATAKQMVNS
jgi:hemoglobin